MGGVASSLGGFLGVSGGPKAPTPENYVGGLDQLNQMNSGAAQGGDILNDYAQGNISSGEALNKGQSRWGEADPFANMGLKNALATGATTGSKYATEQVEGNPILGGLYGQGGQLSQAEGKLTDLQNQGFNLKPEDQSLYGQESGQIARQFGQQGNETANNLASRGLSSSGAAGAQFSGLQGNQNEMLAKAQQDIAQQRFQNTMGQIGQYQNFVNSMGANAGNAIQQQYGRQLGGVQQQTAQESNAAGAQTQANNQANNANMSAANFNVKNTPKNFMDFVDAGIGQGLQDDASSFTTGKGLFGGGSTPKAPPTPPAS